MWLILYVILFSYIDMAILVLRRRATVMTL